MTKAADDVRSNRAFWDAQSDEYQRAHGPQLDKRELAWGIWALPERELGALGDLGDLAGRPVLELGCGGGQWATFLKRRGIRAVGIDLSAAQLDHARRFARERGASLPLVLGDACMLPFNAASFDLVFCDHGATTFADPYATVPEAARVLRPGGRFVFNMQSPLLELCWPEGDDDGPPTERLQRDYFALHRSPDDDGSVTYQIPYGEWVRLFRRSGFTIEDLIEPRPPAGATTTYGGWSLAWARRWPMEHIWVLRRD